MGYIDKIGTFVGSTDSADGKAGLVSKPIAGDEGKFLKGDGTWGEAGGGGGGDATGDVLDIQVTEVTDTDSFSISGGVWTDVPGMSVTTTPDSIEDWALIGGIVSLGSNNNSTSFHFRVVRSDGKVIDNHSPSFTAGYMGGDQPSRSVTVFSWPIYILDREVGTTDALTYKVQVRNISGITAYINKSESTTDSSLYARTYSQLNLTRFSKTDNGTDTFTNISTVRDRDSEISFTSTEYNSDPGTYVGFKGMSLPGLNEIPVLSQNSTAKSIFLASVNTTGTNNDQVFRLLNSGEVFGTYDSPGNRTTIVGANNGIYQSSSYSATVTIGRMLGSINRGDTLSLNVVGTWITSTQVYYPNYMSNNNRLQHGQYNKAAVISFNTAKSGSPYKQIVESQVNTASSSSVSAGTDYDPGLSVTVTPTDASSKLLIQGTVSMNYNALSDSMFYTRFQKDGSDIFTGDVDSNRRPCTFCNMASGDQREFTATPFWLYTTAGSTSAQTFKVLGSFNEGSSANCQINRTYTDSDSYTYPRTYSEINVIEILPNS
jgi:hypothetical protein